MDKGSNVSPKKCVELFSSENILWNNWCTLYSEINTYNFWIFLNRFIRIVDSPINIVKFSKTYPSTHFFELRRFETLLSGLLITYGDTASSRGVSTSLLDELIVYVIEKISRIVSKFKLNNAQTSLLAKGMNFAPSPNTLLVDDVIEAKEKACARLSQSEAAQLRGIIGSLKSSKVPASNLNHNEQKA